MIDPISVPRAVLERWRRDLDSRRFISEDGDEWNDEEVILICRELDELLRSPTSGVRK